MLLSVGIYKEKKEKNFRMVILPSGKNKIGLTMDKDYGIISYLDKNNNEKIGEFIADVVAVPVEAGRVVVLPEGAQQGLAARADDGGVVDHPHRLGVAGDPGAHLLVGGVGRRAAHVADGGDHDAGPAPQDALHAPEAAAGQVEHLGAPRPGAVQRRAQDDVLARVGQDRGLPPGQDGGARGARRRSGAHADTLPSRGAGTGPRSRRGRAAGAHRVVTSRISASICLPLGAA